AIIAVAVAAVGILLYITWAFRRMPKPFHYGVCAIIARVHDVVLVTGDGDFAPLVQRLRLRGVRVEVASTEDSASAALPPA
ncbi:MAG: NYN domain-containing protein, partial [Anaerolineae bacterium]